MSASLSAFFLPIHFIPLSKCLRNKMAIESGAPILPLMCRLVSTVIVNGALMSTYGYFETWYLLGGYISLIGGAVVFSLRLDTSSSKI